MLVYARVADCGGGEESQPFGTDLHRAVRAAHGDPCA